MEQKDLYKRALQRERRAKKEAERIAEEATGRLHSLNQDLDKKVREATRDLQRRESQLRESHAKLAQALELREQFLASMTHELRSPLHSILGLSEALLEGAFGDHNERQSRSLQTIHNSGQHLLELVNKVLEISKLASKQPDLELELVSVIDSARSVFQLLGSQAKEKSIELSLDGSREGLQLYANTLRYRQVLVNLVSNAIKFTPEGGSVRVRFLEDEERGTLTTQVRDTGIGIPESQLSNIFQAFMQVDNGLARSAEGTGLGLMLVRRIVDLYGGSVAAESTVGEGSTLSFTLPLRAQQEVGTPERPGCGRALVIDDSPVQLMVLTRLLKGLGVEAVEAPDGLSGLHKLRETRPDFVFLDLEMPKLDGFDVLRLIRSDVVLGRTPVAIISAEDNPNARKMCRELRADAFFLKPISRNELKRFLDSIKPQ